MAPDRPVPPDLAARLNAARLRAGLSVAELARACSLSRGHLHEVLTGKRTLSAAVTRRVMAVLHLHEPMATDLVEHATGRHVSSAGFGIVESP